MNRPMPLPSHNLKAPVPQMTDSELASPGQDLTDEQHYAVALEELRRLAASTSYFNRRWYLPN